MSLTALKQSITTVVKNQTNANSITPATLGALLDAVADAVQKDSAHTTSIPFTSLSTAMAAHSITSTLTYTPDTNNAIPTAVTTLALTANGTNTPNFSAFKKLNGSKDWVNTSGTLNLVFFAFINGACWYSIQQEAAVVVVPVQLSTPGSFTATAASSSQINLTWTDVSNEGSYQIKFNAINDLSSAGVLATPAAGATAYNHTGLSASSTFYYWLVAVGNGTTYTNSNAATANATTQSAGQTQLATPNVVFDNITSTSMRLRITAGITNATNYVMQISTAANFATIFQESSGSGLTDTFTSLTPGTTYYGRAKAQGSGYTDSAYGTTSAQTSAAGDTTPPVLQSASIANSLHTRISLLYNEDLNSGSLAASKFAVTVDGTAVNISTVTVNAGLPSIVLVDLQNAITAGQTVLISYIPGTSGARVADVAGNFAAAVSNFTVTNNVNNFVPLDAKAGLVENPAGTWNNTTGFNAQTQVCSTKKIAANGKLWITHNILGGDIGIALDDDSTDDNAFFSGALLINKYTIYTFGGVVFFNQAGYVGVNSGYSPAVGDILQLRRETTGGVTHLYYEYSTDGGVTFTVLADDNAGITGDLWVKTFYGGATNKITNLRAEGLA